VNNDHIRVRFYHGRDTNQGRGTRRSPERSQTNVTNSRISESSTFARIWCRSVKKGPRDSGRCAKKTLLSPSGDQRMRIGGDAGNQPRLRRTTQGLAWVILYQQIEGYKYVDFFYSGWHRALLVTIIAGSIGSCMRVGGSSLLCMGIISNKKENPRIVKCGYWYESDCDRG
jgi:hypothetical protein